MWGLIQLIDEQEFDLQLMVQVIVKQMIVQYEYEYAHGLNMMLVFEVIVVLISAQIELKKLILFDIYI